MEVSQEDSIDDDDDDDIDEWNVASEASAGAVCLDGLVLTK